MAGLVGYGVYSYVSEQQLKALLPEGVAMPENRAQTALLLWNTAGRPEPTEAPAFKDVADPDTAKAAQWCVEHGLKNKHPQRTAPELKQPGHALRMLLLCGGARRLKQKIRTLLFRETVRIFLVWCRNAIQIRTISRGCGFCRFSKGDGLCSFFIVEGYQSLIVIQVNCIDEGIHQRLPLVFQAHIQLAEPQQPSQSNF